MAALTLRVKRTSRGHHNSETPPCDDAVMVAPATEWEAPVWEINIPDLDALQAFAVTYGPIIISPPAVPGTPDDSPYFDGDTHWRLEIYDYYRE